MKNHRFYLKDNVFVRKACCKIESLITYLFETVENIECKQKNILYFAFTCLFPSISFKNLHFIYEIFQLELKGTHILGQNTLCIGKNTLYLSNHHSKYLSILHFWHYKWVVYVKIVDYSLNFLLFTINQGFLYGFL